MTAQKTISKFFLESQKTISRFFLESQKTGSSVPAQKIISRFFRESQKTISRFFRGSPEGNKQDHPWQPRRQKAGSSVLAQKTISRFFRKSQKTIISPATHTVLYLHRVASHDIRIHSNYLNQEKKRGVGGLSSAQLSHWDTDQFALRESELKFH